MVTTIMSDDNRQPIQTGGILRFAACVLLSVGGLDAVFALRAGSGADWLDYTIIAAGVGLFIAAVVYTNRR